MILPALIDPAFIDPGFIDPGSIGPDYIDWGFTDNNTGLYTTSAPPLLPVYTRDQQQRVHYCHESRSTRISTSAFRFYLTM